MSDSDRSAPLFFRLPPGLVAALRLRAVRDGVQPRDVIERLLRASLSPDDLAEGEEIARRLSSGEGGDVPRARRGRRPSRAAKASSNDGESERAAA